MPQIIQSLNEWYSQALQSGGYPLVAFMMVIESSIFPLPSEIVIHRQHTWRIPGRFR